MLESKNNISVFSLLFTLRSAKTPLSLFLLCFSNKSNESILSIFYSSFPKYFQPPAPNLTRQRSKKWLVITIVFVSFLLEISKTSTTKACLDFIYQTGRSFAVLRLNFLIILLVVCSISIRTVNLNLKLSAVSSVCYRRKSIQQKIWKIDKDYLNYWKIFLCKQKFCSFFWGRHWFKLWRRKVSWDI